MTGVQTCALRSLDVPAGHGHSYSREYVDGWMAVLQSEGSGTGSVGWDAARTEWLRDVIGPPT